MLSSSVRKEEDILVSLLPLLTKGFKGDFVPLGEGMRGMFAILTAMVPSHHF